MAPMPDHPHTIDRWDDATGENLIERIAGVGDYLVALGDVPGGGEALANRQDHAAQASAGDRAELGALISPRTHSGPKYRAIIPPSPIAKRTPKRKGAAIRVASTIRVVIIGSVLHTHTGVSLSGTDGFTSVCLNCHPADRRVLLLG